MKRLVGLVVFFIPFFVPDPLFAHAFGAIYTLPLPSWIFLYGGTATVALSFLLVSFFVGQKDGAGSPKRIDVDKSFLIRFFTHNIARNVVKVVGMLLWLGIIVSGYAGSQETTSNIAPTLFWIGFLLGFTYLIAIVGNIWNIVSPFRTITSFFGKSFWREQLWKDQVSSKTRVHPSDNFLLHPYL